MATITTSPTSGAYDAGDNAVGATVEADLQTIVSEFNGSIDAANLNTNSVTTVKISNSAVDSNKLAAAAVRQTHVDFTSGNSGLEVWQTGPTHVGSSGGRIARVRKTDVVYDGTASPQTITFTFATDCVDGNPAFSAPPTLLGPPIVTASSAATADDMVLYAYVTNLTAALVTMEVYYDIGATGNLATTVTMEFGVAGAI